MVTKTIALAFGLALTLSATASAQHGNGGGGAGGGGGGGVPAPPAACNALVSNAPFQTINRKASLDLKFNVANCGTATQVITTDVVSTLDTVLADGTAQTCTAASWTAATLTLKPGDKRGFSTTVPSAANCPLGASGGVLRYTATARDAAGTVVGTAVATANISLAF